MEASGGIRNRTFRIGILVGMFVVALNLRPAITSVPPLIEVIRADLGLTYASVSLLTAIPVLCMGLFALGTPRVTKVFGREQAIFWMVALISGATILRAYGESWFILLVSTVVIGVGIAVGQTILPSIVKTYFPESVAFATGLYTASLAIGAALASGLTVFLQTVFGSWTWALAAWGLLGIIGLIAWFPVMNVGASRTQSGPDVRDDSSSSLPLRNAMAWRATIFLGITANFFFIGITWIPARYVALGWPEGRGGILLTVFILAGLIGMFSISAFGDRTLDRRPWIASMGVFVLVGTAAIGIVPTQFPWLFVAIFGIGSGGLFTLALMLPTDFAVDTHATVRLSTMVFAGGYLLAGIGPYVIGFFLDIGISYGNVFVGMAFGAIALGVLSIPFSTANRGAIGKKTG